MANAANGLWSRALGLGPRLWLALHIATGLAGAFYGLYYNYPAWFWPLLGAYLLALAAADWGLALAPAGRGLRVWRTYWAACGLAAAAQLLLSLLGVEPGGWAVLFWLATPLVQLLSACYRPLFLGAGLPMEAVMACAAALLLAVSAAQTAYCAWIFRRKVDREVRA